MKDYSQNREQAVILRNLAGINGTLLDIGANDGITFSNTRALVELGWSGVLVEPSRTAFLKLCSNMDAIKLGDGFSWFHQFDGPNGLYKITKIDESIGLTAHRLRAVNAAITTQDGPIDFWDSGTHLRKGDTSLLSTTRPEEMKRWKTSGEKFTKTTVRGITFATLLKECGLVLHSRAVKGPLPNNAATFDFINIDAEGADYSILEQIDLSLVGCRCLCVEYNFKDQQKFANYAARFGMRLAWKNRENLIFVT